MKPEIEEVDDIHCDHKERHPAYGLLQVSRISGNATLFDSEFNHQHFICLRIHPAEVTRNLSNNWIHEKGIPYVEVELSEAQWATAISSLNSGSGTPCTLKYVNGEQVPKIEREPGVTERKFKDELQKSLEQGKVAIEKLSTAIDDGKMAQKLKKELLWKVEQARRCFGGSTTEFIANQFSEHMEGVKEKGKAELHAHAQQLGMIKNDQDLIE